jgi:uncharacterized membrane protein
MIDLLRRKSSKPEVADRRSRLAPSNRTESISDGVFAIAITLLVLDLHIPGPAQQAAAGGPLQAILKEWLPICHIW